MPLVPVGDTGKGRDLFEVGKTEFGAHGAHAQLFGFLEKHLG